MKKTYIVIGLGIFGMAIAKQLGKYHLDVLAVDRDIKKIEEVADYVTQANAIDVIDCKSLQEIGAAECDVAVVAMGDHLESAILTVMHLKELGVRTVIAKANTDLNATILKKVGADEVVQPENGMGIRLAKALLSDSIHDVIEIDAMHSIVEMSAPREWLGKTILELDLRNRMGMNILGIRSLGNIALNVHFSPNYIVQPDDSFVVFAGTHIVENFDHIQK